MTAAGRKTASRRRLGRLLAAACLSWPVLAAAGDDELRKHMDEAHKLAARILDQIRGEVVRALENGGPLRAVVVCKYSAPDITSTISRQSGKRITRVTLKPRNRAIGEPDTWEQGVLLDFEKRLSKGEKVADLEHAAIVQEPIGRYFRYMKAIPMGPACVACHGANVSDALKAMLAAEYPYDKATDYAIGQVRGAVSIKQPL